MMYRNSRANPHLYCSVLFGLFVTAPVLLSTVTLDAGDDSESRPNVLFIAVDDLRPQLGCYGEEQMITPHIDRLAAAGVLFNRAYCQVAVCGASRASIMSGCRPETTRCWNYNTPLRAKMPDVLTLPGAFKRAGYQTSALGKVYHRPTDDHESWSVDSDSIAPPDPGRSDSYALQENRDGDKKRKRDGTRFSPSTENGGDIPDSNYKDAHNAERAIKMLQHLKDGDAPFFLAVGFSRPHLPFATPDRYWKMYDRSKIKVPSTKDVIGGVRYGRSTWGELKNYIDIPRNVEPVDKTKAKELIHGYYASTSFTDAQVGKLLNALDELNLTDSTIIVLWGDHGWYLGDFGDWCKHSNYEVATRVPLIVSVPKRLGDYQGASTALVELVDVYPTLCELSGLEIPQHCEGDSLVPLLKSSGRDWKAAAYSQYQKTKPGTGTMLGTSVRTDRFRYTEWRNIKNGKVDAIELIDFKKDPDATVNVADEKAYQDRLPELEMLAKQSGTGVRPPN